MPTKGGARRINLRLGEPSRPEGEQEDPEVRRIRGNRRRLNLRLGEEKRPMGEKEDLHLPRIRKQLIPVYKERVRRLEQTMREAEKQRLKIWDDMEFLHLYPEHRADFAIRKLDMVPVDEVDEVLRQMLTSHQAYMRTLGQDLKLAKDELRQAENAKK